MAEHGDPVEDPGARGTLTIADQVVERIAVHASAEVDDVHREGSGWRASLGRSLPQASATVAGDLTRVSVTLASTWPSPLSTVAGAVRAHVGERVSRLTGLTVTAVDVTVADVLAPAPPRRVR